MFNPHWPAQTWSNYQSQVTHIWNKWLFAGTVKATRCLSCPAQESVHFSSEETENRLTCRRWTHSSSSGGFSSAAAFTCRVKVRAFESGVPRPDSKEGGVVHLDQDQDQDQKEEDLFHQTTPQWSRVTTHEHFNWLYNFAASKRIFNFLFFTFNIQNIWWLQMVQMTRSKGPRGSMQRSLRGETFPTGRRWRQHERWQHSM